MYRFARALMLVSVLALAFAACASNKDTGLPAGPTSPKPGSVCDGNVDMNDALKFAPETCTVKVDTKVTWKNVGSLPHTVTAEDLKAFDSGDTSKPVAGGGTFEFTFKTAGEFPYFCRLHASRGARSGMIGTIKVEAA
jgi:plastocyanin